MEESSTRLTVTNRPTSVQHKTDGDDTTAIDESDYPLLIPPLAAKKDSLMSRKRERPTPPVAPLPPSPPLVPFRDVSNLFAHPVTWRCAVDDHCIPCAYKVGCWDVALDTQLCRIVPNVRPELCPRASAVKALDTPKNEVLGYGRSVLRVLTLGDGDFSFSLAVARLVRRKDPQHMQSDAHNEPCVYATSYESLETLRGVYDNLDETLSELKRLDVRVMFEVDATRLDETLFSRLEMRQSGENTPHPTFDRIVWNFPCAAVARGQDGQNQEMDRNKDMVRRFVSQSSHYLAPGGEIHMNHKTKPPYNQWRIEEVAVEDSQDDAPVVTYLGRVVVDRYLLPPYTPRKALCRKSFPVHDACTYVFGVAVPPQSVQVVQEEDGLNELNEQGNASLSPTFAGLVPVTVDRLRRLRESLLNSSPCLPSKRKRDR